MAFKSFDASRNEFKPYGLTCETWIPCSMPRIDRHNEIELNFIPEGTLTYMLKTEEVTLPEGRLAMFWGLMPHRIIGFDKSLPYYVCTIPLAMFLKWGLPDKFVNDLLAGKVLVDSSEVNTEFERFIFNRWVKDLALNNGSRASLLELQARILRFSDTYTFNSGKSNLADAMVNKIEKMALFVAANYTDKITLKDVGEAVDLNPDYANAVFRKAFGHTLMEQVIIERITHAQRELLSTNHSIFRIAMECGFSTISSFNMAFRKISGCTPRDYRKRKE